jgi:hypothetical protein
VAADVDWSNLPIAAAFILGAVGGTIATIRITRYVLDYLRNERDGPPRSDIGQE